MGYIYIYIYIYNYSSWGLKTMINQLILVGGIPAPLKNMSSSVGMINFPTEWTNKMHVPVTTNQQWWAIPNPVKFCRQIPFKEQQIRVFLHFDRSNIFLVGGFNPSEKYDCQLGWLFPIYGKQWNMFQTTNQCWVISVICGPWNSRCSSRLWLRTYFVKRCRVLAEHAPAVAKSGLGEVGNHRKTTGKPIGEWEIHRKIHR